MITKSKEEIKMLREGGRRLASVLFSVAEKVKPGVPTIGLDSLAEKLIREFGGEPSFKNYAAGSSASPYPASLCVSINGEVVHGIPKKGVVLKEGNLLSLDLGLKYKGLYTDMAITVPVGKISKATQKLIKVTEESLKRGIEVSQEGATLGDVGSAIQKHVETRGFYVVKNLVGHGVGYAVHEPPEIPNFGEKGKGERLREGAVLALEPMVTKKDINIILDDDEWTWKTEDGSLSAHFEHTIVVTDSGAEILTAL